MLHWNMMIASDIKSEGATILKLILIVIRVRVEQHAPSSPQLLAHFTFANKLHDIPTLWCPVRSPHKMHCKRGDDLDWQNEQGESTEGTFGLLTEVEENPQHLLALTVLTAAPIMPWPMENLGVILYFSSTYLTTVRWPKKHSPTTSPKIPFQRWQSESGYSFQRFLNPLYTRL